MGGLVVDAPRELYRVLKNTLVRIRHLIQE